jgi:hypothetical protein
MSQTPLGLRALRLIGQIGAPGGIEGRQLARQAGDGRHQRWQMGLRQSASQALA